MFALFAGPAEIPHATKQGTKLFISRLKPSTKIPDWIIPAIKPMTQSSACTFQYALVNGHPSSSDPEANLYLALLYLWLQDYERAKSLLDHTAKDHLSAESKEILEWIQDYASQSGDHDLRAIALLLKATAMLGECSIDRCEQIKHLHRNYLQHGDHLSRARPWLESEEERRLGQSIYHQTEKPSSACPKPPLSKDHSLPEPSRFIHAWQQSEKPEVSSLIRPSTLYRFETYYRLARHGIWSSEIGEKRLTRSQDLFRLFRLIKQCSVYEPDQWAATLLERVVRNPERYPSSHRMHHILKRPPEDELADLFR